ncbi:MAG TPA: ModD protein [Rubrivivax sp.]|nr:ModD protein [Rubrivivax sp.]
MTRCELSDAALQALLAEDAPFGDLTSSGLALCDRAGAVEFSARAAMVVAGTEEAARLIELCGARARVVRGSAERVDGGALLIRAEGGAEALLLAWKLAQNLVEWGSGIASATRRIVDELAGAGHAIPVACTRKGFPGTRALAAKAVRVGGGVMHRLGLSESLLVFPEHRAFLADEALPARIAALRSAQREKKLVVEVTSEDEALRMAALGADVLQLERFSPDGLAALRRRLDEAGRRPLLAPAGGVNLGNAVAFAAAGADFLVTSSPYLAGPADVKVRVVSSAGAAAPGAAG